LYYLALYKLTGRGMVTNSMEIKIDDKQIAGTIINDLKRHNLLGQHQNVTVVYNAESNDVVYTVSEVAELIKTKYVYDLIKAGLLPALKLGSMKVTRLSLLEFIEKYN
jgi:hypothetical protein